MAIAPIRHRLPILAGLLALSTALPLLSTLDWRIDLLSHFVLYRLMAAAGLLALAALCGSKGSGAILVLCLFVDGVRMAPLYARRAESVSSPSWKIVHFNVLTENPRKQDVVRYLRGTNADLIFLAEVDEAWARAIRDGLGEYRVIAEAPRGDNFGMMALSAVDSSTATVHVFGAFDLPAIEVRATRDQRSIEILAVHALPPISGSYAEARDRDISEAAAWATTRTASAAIVLGDLNATPWSRPFRAFIAATSWQSSQDGFGYQPTWRAAPGLAIPIDHLLHSPKLGVTRRKLGPDLGSDHLPLEVELQ